MDTPSVKEYIDARFETINATMDAGFSKLRSEMHEAFADQLKWFVGTMIAMFVATVAVMTFLFNNLAARIPQQPVSPSAPIVIAVPIAPPPPGAAQKP